MTALCSHITHSALAQQEPLQQTSQLRTFYEGPLGMQSHTCECVCYGVVVCSAVCLQCCSWIAVVEVVSDVDSSCWSGLLLLTALHCSISGHCASSSWPEQSEAAPPPSHHIQSCTPLPATPTLTTLAPAPTNHQQLVFLAQGSYLFGHQQSLLTANKRKATWICRFAQQPTLWLSPIPSPIHWWSMQVNIIHWLRYFIGQLSVVRSMCYDEGRKQ